MSSRTVIFYPQVPIQQIFTRKRRLIAPVYNSISYNRGSEISFYILIIQLITRVVVYQLVIAIEAFFSFRLLIIGLIIVAVIIPRGLFRILIRFLTLVRYSTRASTKGFARSLRPPIIASYGIIKITGQLLLYIRRLRRIAQ